MPRPTGEWDITSNKLIPSTVLPECYQRGCLFRFTNDEQSDGVLLLHIDPDTKNSIGQVITQKELADPTADIWGRVAPFYRRLHDDPPG